MAIYMHYLWTNLAIGDLVKKARKEAGLTQKELAAKMRERDWNWSTAIQTNLELGKRDLRFREAIDLASLLDCSISDFIPMPKEADAPVPF